MSTVSVKVLDTIAGDIRLYISTQMGEGWEGIFIKCLFLEAVLFPQNLDNNSLIAHSTEREARHK